MLRYVALGLLILAMTEVPGPVSASVITVETNFIEGFFDSHWDNQFVDVSTSTGTQVSLSNTFNSSTSAHGGTGTLNGSATSVGVFDANGLRMGASASASAAVSGFALFPYGAAVLGRVQVDDGITLLGGTTGENGFLRMVFDIDGSLAAQAIGARSTEAGLSLVAGNSLDSFPAAFSSLADFPTSDPVFSGSPSSFPARVTVDLRFILGVEYPLAVALFTHASVYLGAAVDGPASGTATSDFDSTITLLSVQVLDASKNPIPDATILSENGLIYPLQDGRSGSVPIPPSILLMVAALVGLAARRRRRR